MAGLTPLFCACNTFSIKMAGLTPLFFALVIPYSMKMAVLTLLFFTGSNFCTRKSKEERNSKIFVDLGTFN